MPRRTRLFDRYITGQGLSLSALARRIHMSHSYLSQIRSGQRPISKSFEIKCSYWLGVPREELFYDDNGDEQPPEQPTEPALTR